MSEGRRISLVATDLDETLWVDGTPSSKRFSRTWEVVEITPIRARQYFSARSRIGLSRRRRNASLHRSRRVLGAEPLRDETSSDKRWGVVSVSSSDLVPQHDARTTLSPRKHEADTDTARPARNGFPAGRAVVSALAGLLFILPLGGLTPSAAAASTPPSTTVTAYDAPYLGAPPATNPAVVGVTTVTGGGGYYVLRSNGEVDAYGAPSYGSLASASLATGATATGIALDATTGGYWIVSSNGTVKGFNAPFLGEPHITPGGWGQYPAAVAIAAAPDGTGYYVLRANGEIDGYGAALHGSLAASKALPVGGLASALAVDPSTGGYYVTVDVTPLDGYLNPLRAVTSLVPQEIDQGVDYCASGPVYALGDAVVVNLYDPEWPSGVFISYRLTNGPAKGLYVYVAENVTPKVLIGEHVTPTTVVGVVHDAKTCLETGWADPPASPEHAAAHLEYNGENSTAYGLNFNSLLQVLGARPGLSQPDGPPGPLPSSWPRW